MKISKGYVHSPISSTTKNTAMDCVKIMAIHIPVISITQQTVNT